MFVIPTIAVLFTFVYMRPHEIFAALRPLNVNLVAGLVLFAFVLDLRVGNVRLRGSSLLVALLVLFAWCILTVAIKAPDRLNDQLALLGISLIAFLAISQGLQSLRAIGVAAGLLLSLTLMLAAIGVYQGLTPTVCFAMHAEATPTGLADINEGRPCTVPGDCREGGIPEREYWCEHPGLLGTHSYAGRVRYRGLLEDPNELAWAVAMGTPLAFALYERRRSARRMAVLIAMLVLGATCVVMAQSRSGQIAMVAMLTVYFVRRFGWKGASVAVVAALPLLLLGGRSGEEAESSSLERMTCWAEALSMWRDNPFVGIGCGQFTEHYYLTAHNSFMLTLAELGPAGLLLWTASLYIAVKITVRVQIDFAGRGEAAAARTWATALLASLVGMAASSFFLTLAYHPILWIFLGLAAALYASVRVHEPSFQVRFGWRDAALVLASDVFIVVALTLYLKSKGIA